MSIAEKLTAIAENQQKVFDAGKQAEYDRFWDEFQDYGNRTNYTYAFAYGGWTDETYNPKYKIRPTMSNNIFMSNADITDTKVTIDLTNPNGNQKFGLFTSATKLKTIRKLIINETNIFQASTSTFNNCKSLENITFEGIIGKSIDFQWSTLLSRESIENIVSCLSTTATDVTLTLSETAVNNAFTQDEWNTLIAQKPNWTISLV